MYTKLRDLREDNDLTQIECAKIALISKNSYIRYEKGEREPPLDIIILLANHYNVSIDYIAGRTNDKRGIGYADSFRDGISITQQNNTGDNNVTIKK